MLEQTGQNFQKAWFIADFLNGIGYFSGRFFDVDLILKMCWDESELNWWYQKILKDEGKLK